MVLLASRVASIHVESGSLLLSVELLLLSLQHDLLVLLCRHHHLLLLLLLIVLVVAGSVLHRTTSSVIRIHFLLVEECAVSSDPAWRLVRAVKLPLIVLSTYHCSWSCAGDLLRTRMHTNLVHSHRGGVRGLPSVCAGLSYLRWNVVRANVRSHAELLNRRGTCVQPRIRFLCHTSEWLPKAELHLLLGSDCKLTLRCLRGIGLLSRAITSCCGYLFSLLIGWDVLGLSLLWAAQTSTLFLSYSCIRWGSLILAIFRAFLKHLLPLRLWTLVPQLRYLILILVIWKVQ